MTEAQFWSDPYRRQQLEAAADEQQRRHAALRQQIGAAQGQALADMLRTYPTLSAELSQGVFAADAQQTGSTMSALAMREERVRGQEDDGGVLGWLKRNIADPALSARNWVFDRAKSGVRGLFTLGEGMWEELLARPFRTAVGMAQGMDPGEAWGEAGASDLLYAIRELRAGREVNLGTGFIAQSDDPAESDVYKAAIAEGLSEDEALRRAEAEIGAPITEEGREQRQTGITFRGQPVSMGRVLAGSFLEPGTKPYHLLSGLVDVAARLALDPMARTLRGLSYAKKGAELFGAIEAPAGESLAAITARNFAAGLIPGIRKTVLGQSVDGWLMSKDGLRVAEAIANTSGDDAILLIKGVLQRNNPTSVSRKLILDLADETDPVKVSQLLAPHLGKTVLGKPGRTTIWKALGLPSLTRGAGGLIGGEMGEIGGFGVAFKASISNTRLGRMFEKLPGRSVAIDNLDDGFQQLDEFMLAGRVKDSIRAKRLREWAALRDNDPTGALRVMKHVMRDIEDDLVDSAGIPRELAQRVTYMFDDIQSMRSYFIDKIGQPGWFPGAETVWQGGKQVTMPTAHRLNEYLHRAIPLPDPVELRRAFSQIDKAHRYVIGARKGALRALRPTEKGRLDEFQEALRAATHDVEAVQRGALETLTDFYMGKVWKPMVLLRLAWPVRVIGEEQLRMAGAGLNSIFSHPLSYIAWQYNRGKTGVLEAAGEWADLAAGRSHRAAMSVGSGGFIDDQGRVMAGKAVGARQGYANYQRSGPRKPYLDAWAGKMTSLADDGVARAVADDIAVARQRFWDGDLKPQRLALARGSAKKAQVLNTRAGSDLYLESIRAEIAESTGGTFKVINRRTSHDFRPGVDRDLDAQYVIQGGNQHLQQAIATGDLQGVRLRNIGSPADVNRLKRKLGSSYMMPGSSPEIVSGASWLDATATSGYDRAVTSLFNALMSKPTNRLSRSPAFRQFYWERMEALAPQMSEAALARTLRAANAANLDRAAIRRLEGIRGAAASPRGNLPAGVIDNLAEADDLAKAFALHSTKKLLYDLSTRHQWTSMAHNVFPFGEAWVEILTSWGRLMYRNPQILRRGQQTVEGARGAGIFYKDPVSGEEVFAYPGGGLLAKWMFGDDSPASLRLQGTVQGLNLAAGSYLPGFGPMVQFPASWVIPNTPDADGIRRLILPYGSAKIGSPGGIIDEAMPAWARKIVQAVSAPGASTELARLQGNTTIDVLRAMLLSGKWNLDSPEAAEAAIRSASKKSTLLTLIRGVAQLGLPTGPQVAFQAEDAEGRAYFFQVLSSEYFDKLQNTFDGDESEAMAWFIGTYGFNPYDIVTPKTQVVSRRSVTGPGDQWARDNEDLFGSTMFPHTAYFARPDQPEEEFDYQAYIRQLETGARVGYTPEQWATARNQTLGRVRYQRYKDRLGGRTDIYARQYLSQVRAWLETQYPGYGYPNVGTVVTPDQKMMNAELERWQDEPRLAQSDAGRGLTAYMRMIAWAETQSRAAGLSADGYRSAERLIGLRQALRVRAQMLMAQYPDFAGLWRYLLEPQLVNDQISQPSETADTLLDELTGGSI